MTHVLVVMLTDILSLWFSGGEWQQYAAPAGLFIFP